MILPAAVSSGLDPSLKGVHGDTVGPELLAARFFISLPVFSKFDLIDSLDKGREEDISDFGDGWCGAVCASIFRDIFRDSIISSINFAASLLPLHVCGLFLLFTMILPVRAFFCLYRVHQFAIVPWRAQGG